MGDAQPSTFSAAAAAWLGVPFKWGGRVAPFTWEREDTVTLSRTDYRRLVHYAQAGINLLAEPNGQTNPEPYEPGMAWLTQLDKEVDG